MTELSRAEAAVGLRDFAPLLEGAENAGTTRFAGAAPLGLSRCPGRAPAAPPPQSERPWAFCRPKASGQARSAMVRGFMWGCGVIPLFFGLDPGFSYTRIFRFLDPKKTRFLWYLNQMLKWPYWAHFWSWSQS